MRPRDGGTAHRLTLRTRFVSEPCLWSWEIVCGDGDSVVLESSWEDQWLGYASREAAQHAGAAALAELLDVPAAS
jgi:hypothetical protein